MSQLPLEGIGHFDPQFGKLTVEPFATSSHEVILRPGKG